MNRYIMIRRLRGPAFLLLIGVLALMHEAHIIGNFWHLFWPLALILAGVRSEPLHHDSPPPRPRFSASDRCARADARSPHHRKLLASVLAAGADSSRSEIGTSTS